MLYGSVTLLLRLDTHKIKSKAFSITSKYFQKRRVGKVVDHFGLRCIRLRLAIAVPRSPREAGSGTSIDASRSPNCEANLLENTPLVAKGIARLCGLETTSVTALPMGENVVVDRSLPIAEVSDASHPLLTRFVHVVTYALAII
jgi:hypothetical protein